MTMRSSLWLAILVTAPTLGAGERKVLELVWLDHHSLFPDFERVRSEVDPIFRDLGVEVRYEVGTDPGPSLAGGVRIQVVLMPSEPSGWGIAPNAMGVVLLPKRSRPDSVFLFYRPILRNLGLARREGSMLNARERKDIARAIARVLVHEVVHAVVPSLSHADDGVMHDELLIGALSNDDIEVDDRTRAEVLRAFWE